MSEYYTLGSWDSVGVPNYLSSVETIAPDLINRIIDFLPEGVNLATTHPDLLVNTTTRNLLIQSSDPDFIGADVYATFLYEGAGYLDVMGYYVYPLNGGYTVPTKWDSVNGVWTPMVYGDQDAVDENGKSTLYKTIIFPNASLPAWENDGGRNPEAGGGNLLPGSTVKLLYNPNNPSIQFPNYTGVGFFVIPNGWNGTVHDANPRVYSDDVFNTNGVRQTLLLYDAQDSDSGAAQLIISFEDLMRPGGDSDFNDVIVSISCTPDTAVPQINDAVTLPTSSAITVDQLVLDRSGMYYQMQTSTINSYITSIATTFYFTTTITMSNYDNQYNILKEILESFQLANNGTILSTNNDNTDDQSVENTLTIRVAVPRTNLQNYIYFFDSFINNQYSSPDNPDFPALAEFSNIYIRNTFNNVINYGMSVDDNQGNNYVSYSSVSPDFVNLSSPYAMGDPHIKTIKGDTYDLPNTKDVYELYNDNELVINTQLEHFYMNNDDDELKDLTFMYLISIQLYDKFAKRKGYIIADLTHPNNYYKENVNKYIQAFADDEDYKLFEVIDEWDTKMLAISRPRRQEYIKLADTTTFTLKYIKFETERLGTVYLELMFIPHRKDFVNSISLIHENNRVLYAPNAKGALIDPKYAKTIPKLILYLIF